MALGGIISGVTQLAGAFGNRHRAPNMVPYEEVDPQAEQMSAVRGNLDALGDIEDLLSRVNTYSQSEANRLLDMAVPGLSGLRSSLTQRAQEMADDPYALPPDVEQHLSRIAAERGVNLTGGRSQFGDFSALRDLGLNSLQYGQSRLAQSQGLTAMLAAIAPRVSPASPASFFVSPQTQIGVTMDNNKTVQGIAQMHENAKASVANWNNDRMWSGIQAWADTNWAWEQQTFQNSLQVGQLLMQMYGAMAGGGMGGAMGGMGGMGG